MKTLRKLLLVVSFALVTLTVVGAATGVSPHSGSYRYLSNFADTLELIQSSYVESRPVDSVMDGAFQGLVDALDADSAYLPPDEVAALSQPAHATAWTGIDVSKSRGVAAVVSVAPGSPAAAQGLKNGDYIRTIDGHATRSMNVLALRRALEGPVGSTVKLKTYGSEENRDGKELTLTREVRKPATVTARLAAPGSAYLAPSRFDSGIAAELRRKLDEVAADKPLSGIVVDLRGVSEGELTEGLVAAEVFLAQGTLARLRGRADETAARRLLKGLKVERSELPAPEPGSGAPTADGFEFKILAAAKDNHPAAAVVVLIDGGTAGAAEIFAAALVQNQRAQSVGQRSFGRAGVQDILPTGDGSALRLTVASFYTPDGHALTGHGLEPTTAVEPTAKGDEDPVLEKALELLSSHGREKKAA